MASSHRRAAKRFFWATWWIAGRMLPECCGLVMGMVEAGTALCVPGNHDIKLMRKLRGKNVQITHGLAESLSQLEAGAAGVSRGSRQFH